MSEKDSKDIKVERNPKINIQEADPSLPPSEPKPAATVLLVRTIEEAVEVFMIQRSIKTNFGGAWVFPGGKLDEYDLKDELIRQTIMDTQEDVEEIKETIDKIDERLYELQQRGR